MLRRWRWRNPCPRSAGPRCDRRPGVEKLTSDRRTAGCNPPPWHRRAPGVQSYAAGGCDRESHRGRDPSSPSGEDLAYALDRRDEPRHIVGRAVAAERGAGSCGHAEKIHDRHCTMMSGAYGDPFVIEDRTDVVRMRTFHNKRDDGSLVCGGTDDLHAANGA